MLFADNRQSLLERGMNMDFCLHHVAPAGACGKDMDWFSYHIRPPELFVCRQRPPRSDIVCRNGPNRPQKQNAKSSEERHSVKRKFIEFPIQEIQNRLLIFKIYIDSLNNPNSLRLTVYVVMFADFYIISNCLKSKFCLMKSARIPLAIKMGNFDRSDY
jgi:hypothetical protein